MTHAKELNPHIAAMYLGCEVEWFGEAGYRLAGINTGQSDFNEIGLLLDDGISVWVNRDEVKLILRPVSSMTGKDLAEMPLKPGVERTVWYLKNSFDIFGLIDAGLAIDKTVKP